MSNEIGFMTHDIKSSIKTFIKILRKYPSSIVGLIIIIGYAVMASIGPILLPYDPSPKIQDRFLPPSLQHPLGTDFAGRDNLAQIVHGSRDVLTVAILTASITVIIAFSIGIFSGYMGGKIDTVLTTIMDIFLIIPSFPLLVIVAASVPRALTAVEIAFVISLVGWAGLARAIRSQVLAIKRSAFIEAARCLGLSSSKIVFGEILPNLMPYVAMNLILSIIGAVYSQVGLYFLGLLPFTTMNWGMMINIAMQQSALINPKAWPYLLSPIGAIILLQTGFILFMSALEEIFNPRLRTE